MIRIATDVGGTFTDLVAIDDATGRVIQAKALTTPADPSLGVLEALRQAGLDGAALASAGFFVHGGTTVINAILERKGVPTAFVTTAGFRDVLEIGRGNRPDLYNLRARSPASFIPRRLRFEVEERMDAAGQVLRPLCRDSLDRAGAAIAASGVQAVAIMFLHAYINPAHEKQAAAFLRERLPGIAVVASHDVSRRWREFERGSTVALTAYVQPMMDRYLANLADALRGRRYGGPIYIMQSNAGLTGVAGARANPLALVESGPSGGVAGAAHVARLLGSPALLHLDVGGTTAKCSLVLGGTPSLNADYKIEHTRLNPGYPVQVPVVDIVEIGAGGGSIIRIGPAGGIEIGPDSAGADPGPACYGRGGAAATLTDAKLLTGVLDPAHFASGLQLDIAAAERAFAPLARISGGSVAEVAEAAIRVAEAKMINALKLVTVQRGHDPRDMDLLVTGGAGPMHAAALGRELGVAHTLIPPMAGLFSAFGMLATAPRVDVARTALAAADAAGLAAALHLFAELEQEAASGFGPGGPQPAFRRSVEMRYRGQEHTVSVAWPAGEVTLGRLLDAFGRAHEMAYTFRLDGVVAELVTYQVTATQPAPDVALGAGTDGGEATRMSRPILIEAGRVTAAVFARDGLEVGAVHAGPALIEEATATTLVLPGQRFTIDGSRCLVITEQA
jgi:N-methylhydantoinase A